MSGDGAWLVDEDGLIRIGGGGWCVQPVRSCASVRTISALGLPVLGSMTTSYITRVPAGGNVPPKAAGMQNMSSSPESCRMKP